VDDHNQRWQAATLATVERLALYHHNYGQVAAGQEMQRKPELLALARWLPSPILPPSAVFREAHTIGRLRYVLQGDDEQNIQRLLTHWQRSLNRARAGQPQLEEDDEVMPEVWHALRRRMNAHKWVHPYYQHVDGTSVAVAQVSGVAAQMMAANGRLTGEEVRRILLATALPLPHLPVQQAGAGLLQGAQAVALALRAPGGPLQGYPLSGSRLAEAELQKWMAQGTLPLLTLEDLLQVDSAAGQTRTPPMQRSGARQSVYFGCFAPHAVHVSLIGSFNFWLPGQLPLQPAMGGWWHAAALLPPGRHTYRFWIETAHDAPDQAAAAFWQGDDENPARCESGYHDDHSVVML
jgi:serine protease AprX